MKTPSLAQTNVKLSVRMRDRNQYDGAALLDFLQKHFNVLRDSHLACHLELTPSALCKIRKAKRLPSPAVLIRIHEVSGLTIAEMCAVMEKPATVARRAKLQRAGRAAHLL